MFSKLFGRNKGEKEKEVPTGVSDYSFLGTDMHSHFIPGIDDGAQTMQDSITLLKAVQAMGYTKIITTPHINFDHYPNTAHKIQAGLQKVQEELKAQNIDLEIKAAAEYYIDDYFFQILERQELMPVSDNQVLVEISMASQPSNLHDILFNMQMKGYKPILAHPERYLFFMDNKTVFNEIKDRGCLLQLNTLSLAGYYGGDVRNMAEYLLENKMYDYAGTDMHHVKHAEVLQRFTTGKTFQKMQKYAFLNHKLVM